MAGLLLSGLNGRAQLNPLSAQYFNNPYLVNPAMAGASGGIRVYGGIRQQWTRISGTPASRSRNCPSRGLSSSDPSLRSITTACSGLGIACRLTESASMTLNRPFAAIAAASCRRDAGSANNNTPLASGPVDSAVAIELSYLRAKLN